METTTERAAMITTVDNPYNPFTQWDEWLAFDISHGYNSWNMVARLAGVSDLDSLSDKDRIDILNDTIKRIVDEDPLGIYIARYE